VAEYAALGVIAQMRPVGKHGKARPIVAHALGAIAHHIQGSSHGFLLFHSLFYYFWRYISKYTPVYLGIFPFYHKRAQSASPESVLPQPRRLASGERFMRRRKTLPK